MRSAIGLALLALARDARACTVVGVGVEAGGGSVFVTHSEDAEGAGDPRVHRVAAAKYEAGAQRAVLANYFGFDDKLKDARRVIGHIPQVPSTYAYLMGGEGAINEKQLIMGETTTASVAPLNASRARDRGGRAMFGIQALTVVAMERCDTARCAVELMGRLAEEHGFYQDEETPNGEALVVGDTKELWHFHVLPDPTGASAVWVGARVPPGHVTANANMFVVRNVDLSNSDDFVGSANMRSAAAAYGRPVGDGEPLDFTKAFSSGEYFSKYYSGRRVWRALTLLAPDSNLPAEYNDLRLDAPYPVSVPAKNVGVRDVMRVHRDYYEGTPYDLSAGAAAGPWGTPNRFLLAGPRSGNWERPISLYRTAHSYIAQARGHLPDAVGGLLWWGPHVAHGTTYVPLPVGFAPPPTYGAFHVDRVDRNSAFWAHVTVQALAEGRFKWVAAEVEALQARLEKRSLEIVSRVDKLYAHKPSAASFVYAANAVETAGRWWEFVDQLIARYADGFVRAAPDDAAPAAIGYPREWLERVGYTPADSAIQFAAPYAADIPTALEPSAIKPLLADVTPLREDIALLRLAAGGEAVEGEAAGGEAATDDPSFSRAGWLASGVAVGSVAGAALFAKMSAWREAAMMRAAAAAEWELSRPVTEYRPMA